MKISEQWLREWADPDVDSQVLVEQLTMAGLEVDGVEPCAPPLEKIVVGRVLEKRKHPNADKLSLCSVDVGIDEPLQIVCGAANVVAGGTFPVATIGAVLPGGVKIKRSKIRGEESFGMLCSATELGIAATADGLLQLDDAAVPGMPVAEALKLDDQIIDLDLTPNRADCFSVIGVARDIAAVNKTAFAEPAVVTTAAVIDDTLELSLDAGDACAAFAGRVLRNIDPQAKTPLWMAEKLRRCGIRPLLPVVDVTNYVMLELGQPMHAYDLAKLNGGLTARMASAGEQLTLLDGQEIALDVDVLVIADQKAPVALAGIMGGEATAVSDSTTDIFLESAFFSPAIMAGRARRFGLHTDASLRFERGVDFANQVRAIERVTELLLEIVGGKPGPVTEVRDQGALPERPAVSLRQDKLDRMLGISIPAADVGDIFTRLGFDVVATDAGWSVTPPPYRFDIAIEEDLVEEVIRLYGYDKVPEIPQRSATPLGRVTETQVSIKRARGLLIDRGYQEIISYSFVDPVKQSALLGDADELELANPISNELSVMRRSLWPGLLQAVSLNRKRQCNRLRLFETGVSFSQQDTEILEEELISGVAWGGLAPEQWSGAFPSADIFDIKSDIESLATLSGALSNFRYETAEHATLRPGRTARIDRDGVAIGWCGELHPKLAKKYGLSPAPVLFELKARLALAACVPAFSGVSRYPSVRRDLAVIVDANISAASLLAAARAAAGNLLRDIRVFDVYTGKGIESSRKSVALGLILQETSRTLTELEIDAVINAVVEQLSSEFNATIRE
ncbi:MAG: phenylalanine--tRNA ligase subunit beta [Gammaproteobacteria bacterium]|nr:MAG: phenylalanine--tRNA ligase subunit beta [Gammaproteobacteria bacterium]